MPAYGDVVTLKTDEPNGWTGLLGRVVDPQSQFHASSLLEVEPLQVRPDDGGYNRFYWPAESMIVIGAPDPTVVPWSPRWRRIVRRFFRV